MPSWSLFGWCLMAEPNLAKLAEVVRWVDANDPHGAHSTEGFLVVTMRAEIDRKLRAARIGPRSAAGPGEEQT